MAAAWLIASRSKGRRSVGFWLFLGLLLLLPPVFVIEGCVLWRGVRRWWVLVRRDLGRVVLYEAMAAGLAAVVALPVAFPLLMAYGLPVPDPRLAVPLAFARVVLAGGLTPENVGEAVRLVRPFAVDVASGVEAAPGKKDSEKMRRLVANARAAAGA